MIDIWARRSPWQRASVGGLLALVVGFGWYATRPVEPPCPYVLAWPSEDMDADFRLTAEGEAHVERLMEQKRASGECAPVRTRWRGWFD
ncbi:hypothetical protein ABZ479_23345 [Streptomyces sp. NPDC005722]